MPILRAAVAILLLGGAAGQIAPTPRLNVRLASNLDTVAPGETISLSLEIQPDRKISVFAPGARDFEPVTLTVTSHRDAKVDRPKYPPAPRKKNPGNGKRVPMYDSAFTIEQPITIDRKAKPGKVVNIVGFLTYQTCDDRVVHPRKRVPLRWAVTVAGPSD